MKKILTLGLLVLSISLQAQELKATSSLEKPAQDGFYKVLLSPAEAQYISPGFSNLRIVDSKNTEVPYILTEEKPVYLQQQFKEYEILEKKRVARAYTSIRLCNPIQAAIDNISILIKNAEIVKTARLSGSDDGKNWFAVKERFTLNYINNPEAVNELRGIEFPLTNYTYYLLEISDSTSTPINILKVGYYDVAVSNGLYSQITSFQTTIETKDKRTYINLQFTSPQLVDKLELTLTGSPFFQRSGFISTKKKRKVKNRYEDYDTILEYLTVRSGQTTIINLSDFKSNNVTFCIENDDNPALSVKELNVYQLNRYLITWLRKDEVYSIRFGNDSQLSPHYDLEYFRDSIPAQPQVLRIIDLKPVSAAIASESTTIFTSKTIIWIAIGGVIILLGFMSVRLIRETNASQKQEP